MSEAKQNGGTLRVSNSFPVMHGSTPPTRIDRISSIYPRYSVDLDLTKGTDTQTGIESLEVIRHKVKVPKNRKKSSQNGGKTKRQDSDSVCSFGMGEKGGIAVNVILGESVMDSPSTPESGYKSVHDNTPPNRPLSSVAMEEIHEENKDDLQRSQNLENNANMATSEKILEQPAENDNDQMNSNEKTLDLDSSITVSEDSGTASQMSVENSTVPQNDNLAEISDANQKDNSLDSTDFDPSCDDSSQEKCDTGLSLDVQHNVNSHVLESSFEGVYDSLDRSLELDLNDSFVTDTPKKVNVARKSSSTSTSSLSHSAKTLVPLTSSQEDNANAHMTTKQKTSNAKSKESLVKGSPFSQSDSSQTRKLVGSESPVVDKKKSSAEESGVMQQLCPWDIK